MIKKTMILLGAMIALLALSACGGAADDPTESGPSEGASSDIQTEQTEAETEVVRLSADYDNALSEQSQLALGTMQLEDSELAVDEVLATELLPLWQALQSLSNSETTAEVELRAVVKQIQDSMAPEQIQAIVGMQLTEDSLSEMFENGDLGFGGFGRQGGADGAGGGGFPGGGFPGGGFPGGGFPGGRPGGGAGGGGFGNFSEDDIATRQAQFAEGGFGEFQDRALTRAVVVLLQTKTGEAPEQRPGGLFNTVFTIVSEETGLSVEEIQSQTAEGITLAEIIESNGGDVEAVRVLLVEALSELPNAEDLDAEQLASEWLGGE